MPLMYPGTAAGFGNFGSASAHEKEDDRLEGQLGLHRPELSTSAIGS